MKPFPTLPRLLIVILCFILSCNPPSQESTKTEVEPDTLSFVSPDTTDVDTVDENDSFYEAVANFSNEFPEYKSGSSHLIDTLKVHANHWLFKIIEKNRKILENRATNRSLEQLHRLPSREEYQTIDEIRQGLFYRSYQRSNDVVLEQWKLKDALGAERWLVLLGDSLWSNQYTKPPRFQWVDGNTLYLVSTRSAAQWSEQRDILTTILSGKTKQQLSNIYDPLDLKHFKKWRGMAHSSPKKDEPHLFTTTKGPHYSYFYFTKHRLKGAQRAKSESEFTSIQDFHIFTTLHNPFTGEEQFDTIEETLVEIQCAINDEALNNLNIVNKGIQEIEELYGSVLYGKGTFKIYGHSNRIIVVNVDQDTVKAFKYMRLRYPFDTMLMDNDLLDNHILRFDR